MSCHEKFIHLFVLHTRAEILKNLVTGIAILVVPIKFLLNFFRKLVT